MKPFMRLWLKNQMLIGNGLANLFGVKVVEFISKNSLSPPPAHVMEQIVRIDRIFLPLAFGSIMLATILYERPIRRCLNLLDRTNCLEGELGLKARQRLLNEPFFLIACDFIVWLISAVVYTGYTAQVDSNHLLLVRMVIQTIITGIITTTAAFFILERMLQRNLAPVLFPQGGLFRIPKTFRIRIRTRLTALVTAANLIPFVVFLFIVRGSYLLDTGPAQAIELLRNTIMSNSILFVAVGIGLTALVNSYLTRPFDEIIRVLRGIVHGRLNQKVSVTTNDEIGYVGDVINEMTEGLKEKEQLRHSLELARGVQQNLLPRTAPGFANIDVAGRSMYCDQTGGDYFDYLTLGKPEESRMALLVGDVSGHGISSALLMATARAFLRQRSFLPGSIADVITDVNRELAEDVGDSGQFMTLFYLVIDPIGNRLQWVRAGHDPAVFYDPQRDSFEELGGPGLALGVDASWQYQKSEKKCLNTGQVIVVGTDGIWESRNKRGEMFGKTAFLEVVRGHASASAEELLEAVIDAVHHFQAGYQPEDDVTLVVVKT